MMLIVLMPHTHTHTHPRKRCQDPLLAESGAQARARFAPHCRIPLLVVRKYIRDTEVKNGGASFSSVNVVVASSLSKRALINISGTISVLLPIFGDVVVLGDSQKD